MSKPQILIIDDERLVRFALSQRCELEGYRTLQAGTAREGVAALSAGVDLVILDFRLPDADGLEVLRRIRAWDAEVPVILMTGFGSLEHGIEAIREGAYHYLCKPFELEEMMTFLHQALETTQLKRELRAYRDSQHQAYAFERLIGESEAIEATKELLRKICRTSATTVLLLGESGTGKDLIAKTIHFNSERASRPFVNITCSDLPEQLLESELFGHERGAFTDAKQLKRGLLEQADGGTVFLDEVGEMTPGLQAKLLRFLEEKTFKRVGGTADISVDARIIAATNRELRDCVQRGTFREDLYFRLRVIRVDVPPLRMRTGDVPRLVAHYVSLFNADLKKNVHGVTPDAMAALEAHAWPGNVRELRNTVERAMLLTDASMLGLADIQPLALADPLAPIFQLPREGVDLDHLERDLVCQALARCGGNQTRAASLLGMNRDQIRYRIEKYGLREVRERALLLASPAEPSTDLTR